MLSKTANHCSEFEIGGHDRWIELIKGRTSWSEMACRTSTTTTARFLSSIFFGSVKDENDTHKTYNETAYFNKKHSSVDIPQVLLNKINNKTVFSKTFSAPDGLFWRCDLLLEACDATNAAVICISVTLPTWKLFKANITSIQGSRYYDVAPFYAMQIPILCPHGWLKQYNTWKLFLDGLVVRALGRRKGRLRLKSH